MSLQEAESKTLTTEETTEAIDKAIAIDADGDESLITEEESLSEGELSDLLNQLEELDPESEISKDELASEPEDSDEEAASRGAGVSKTARAMLSAVNSVRRKYGLSPLRLNACLTSAAQAHSRDMARHKRMSHTGSNGSKFHQRIRQQGYPSAAMAENVASGQSSVKAVMRSWMNSPGHRKNILSRKYNELWVGYAKNGRWYWTQTFGGR